MAKVNIAGIEIDADAQRKNSPAERAFIFAHLKGLDKTKAVQQLEDALQVKPEVKAPAAAEAVKALEVKKEG